MQIKKYARVMNYFVALLTALNADVYALEKQRENQSCNFLKFS